jgi:hypothetical protein
MRGILPTEAVADDEELLPFSAIVDHVGEVASADTLGFGLSGRMRWQRRLGASGARESEARELSFEWNGELLFDLLAEGRTGVVGAERV